MTWDLSTSVADNANDLPPELAWFLHEFHNFADAGAFARNQSKTQVCVCQSLHQVPLTVTSTTEMYQHMGGCGCVCACVPV